MAEASTRQGEGERLATADSGAAGQRRVDQGLLAFAGGLGAVLLRLAEKVGTCQASRSPRRVCRCAPCRPADSALKLCRSPCKVLPVVLIIPAHSADVASQDARLGQAVSRCWQQIAQHRESGESPVTSQFKILGASDWPFALGMLRGQPGAEEPPNAAPENVEGVVISEDGAPDAQNGNPADSFQPNVYQPQFNFAIFLTTANAPSPFRFYGGALALRARRRTTWAASVLTNELNFSSPVPIATPFWTIQTLTPTYQPGFEIGGSYALATPGADIQANWQHLRTRDQQRGGNSANRWAMDFTFRANRTGYRRILSGVANQPGGQPAAHRPSAGEIRLRLGESRRRQIHRRGTGAHLPPVRRAELFSLAGKAAVVVLRRASRSHARRFQPTCR